MDTRFESGFESGFESRFEFPGTSSFTKSDAKSLTKSSGLLVGKGVEAHASSHANSHAKPSPKPSGLFIHPVIVIDTGEHVSTRVIESNAIEPKVIEPKAIEPNAIEPNQELKEASGNVAESNQERQQHPERPERQERALNLLAARWPRSCQAWRADAGVTNKAPTPANDLMRQLSRAAVKATDGCTGCEEAGAPPHAPPHAQSTSTDTSTGTGMGTGTGTSTGMGMGTSTSTGMGMGTSTSTGMGTGAFKTLRTQHSEEGDEAACAGEGLGAATELQEAQLAQVVNPNPNPNPNRQRALRILAARWPRSCQAWGADAGGNKAPPTPANDLMRQLSRAAATVRQAPTKDPIHPSEVEGQVAGGVEVAIPSKVGGQVTGGVEVEGASWDPKPSASAFTTLLRAGGSAPTTATHGPSDVGAPRATPTAAPTAAPTGRPKRRWKNREARRELTKRGAREQKEAAAQGELTEIFFR